MDIKRTQFSEYRHNKSILIYGYYDFIDALSDKKHKGGILKVFPFSVNTSYDWEIIKNFNRNKFIAKSKEFRVRYFGFKNSILLLLRNYGVLHLQTELNTGQFHKGKEIKEIWGYRMLLIDDCVLCESMSSETIYNNCIMRDSKPDYYKVYCGPDGKIFGWDKITN